MLLLSMCIVALLLAIRNVSSTNPLFPEFAEAESFSKAMVGSSNSGPVYNIYNSPENNPATFSPSSGIPPLINNLDEPGTSSVESSDTNTALQKGNSICSCENISKQTGSVFKASSVSQFVRTFNQAVNSSDILQELFDFTGYPVSDFTDFAVKYISDKLIGIDAPDATIPANFAIQGIGKNFKVLNLPTLVRVYGNVMANHLFAQGLLIPETAEDLALSYAKELEESYKHALVEWIPSAKFQAISDGFANFLGSRNAYSYDSWYGLPSLFGMEWMLAALDSNGSI